MPADGLDGTVGKLDLELQLDLGDAGIDQAGQAEGELALPGVHGRGTLPVKPEPAGLAP
ncbi:hypothetical protein [Streptomyces luteogriseus]|uniref:hypothetical protein n=1 Tax=Streptomyces luteogriseus TaxID=68233 RepID=UPI00381651D8